MHAARRGGGLTIAEISGIIENVMAASNQTDAEPKKNKAIPSWEEFLASHPPGRVLPILQIVFCEVVGGSIAGSSTSRYYLRTPDVKLYCDNEACEREQFFECKNGSTLLKPDQWHQIFLDYRCRNCRKSYKTFAVEVKCFHGSEDGEAMKFGEWPPFGPHVPSRVISLIREDRELFLAGRRAESQGIGIGAFAYYRRVVENQKGRIINEIIRVAKKIQAPEKVIQILESARNETRFTAAIESIKDAIPQVLLINGQNLLTLLYKPLSEGLHGKSDKECLQLATSIRTFLTELAERLGQALKDQAEVDAALKHLMKSGSEKGSKTKNKSI